MRRPSLHRWLAAGMAVPLLAVGSAPEDPESDAFAFLRQEHTNGAPVVVVVFDELPVSSLIDLDGDVDRSLFPHFAALQETSTWFRNATTSETFTKEALPALLTGAYPIRELGRSFTYPRNLFTLLGETYEIHAALMPHGVCPPQICRERIVPPPPSDRVRRLRAFGVGERGAEFLSFLRNLRPPDRPRLHLHHSVMPHGPWRYLPSGQRYLETEPMPGEFDSRGRGTSWTNDKWLVAQAYQRHLLQTRLVDDLLGELLLELERTDLIDRAVLVVTADHGVGFEPGLPRRLPVERNAGTLAAIPLFVKAPGQTAGAVSDAPVEAVDVLPTIAGLVDASALWEGLDGVSAYGDIDPDRPRRVFDLPLDPDGGEKYRAVRKKFELLADGRESIDLWRVAPGRSEELLGLGAAELSISSGDVTAQSAALPALSESDPDEDVFPAFLQGTLEGVTGGGRPLVAVMVDGEIAAVTKSYWSHGLLWFGAMVPPHAFDGGRDDVRLLLVSDVRRREVVSLPVVSPAG